MSKNKQLRTLLQRPEMLIAPGVHDGLGARIVEQAGFDAVYISGFCIEASFGLPDMGMLSMKEVIDRAASVADATELPVICDADTGYGNAVSVVRAVQQFERAGISGIHLEDQALPKKCGAFPDKVLVSTDEMVGKIYAAVDARRDENFLLIARTDAVASEGIEASMERGQAYIEAGADLVLVQIPRTLEEIRETCERLPGRAVLTISENRAAPVLTFAEYEKMGLKLGLLPLSLTFRAITAMREAAASIRKHGSIAQVQEQNIGWDEVLDLVQLPRILGWSERYSEASARSGGRRQRTPA